MFTWKRIALASGCFILLVFFFITLILPGIVVTKAQQWVGEETGRVLEIGSISINPILLSVEITGLSLSEKNHAKGFISWDSLQLSLSPKSIFYRAPVIRELRLDHPVVNLERLTADTFNFSDLIPARELEVPAEPSADPARFSVSNLTIKDGQINLVDSSLAEPVRHTVRDLQLVLPAIGNLPSMIGNPTKPMFHAVINDAPINIEGELKPFSKTQEMKVALALQDIDLPFYLGYIPIEMPVNLRNGRLSLDLNLLYRVSEDKGSEFEMSGKIDLASLDIWDRQQQKLFFLPLLRAEIAPSQPLKKQIHLSALRVYNLEVQLNRDQHGAWNHARMAPAGGSSQPQEKPEKTSTPLRLMVDTFEVRDGVIVFADLLPNGGFNSVVREINIDVKNFALDAKQGIPFNLSMETERKEIASGKGQFMLEPFTLDLDIELRNLNLAAYQPYYQDVYAGPLGGSLSLRSKLAINPEQPLLISNGIITWQDPYMAFNQQEGVGASRVEINGLSFDLKQNRLEVDSALYQDGRVNFSRSAEGKWSFLSRKFPILAKLTESPGAKPSPATEQAAPAFNYRIGELALRNWTFGVRDSFPEMPVELEASDFNLTFNNLAAPEKVKSPFTFSTTLQRKGKVEIKGTASLADQTISLQAGLKRIPLATFAPYVAEQVNLVLADGYLDARLRSDVDAGVQPLKASIRGDVGVSQFHLLDGLHSEDLLKWDSLQIAGIETQLSPTIVAIKSITLSDYFAKVLIDEKSRLNLTEAFHKKPAGPPGEVPEAPSQSAAKGLPAEQPTTSPSAHVARIDTIILQGGQVDFTDRHLPRPFHADMRELGGRIEGLTSDLESRATVDLRGKLRNQSPLAISGTVNPLAEKLFVDLKMSFTDIELSPLSPYSGTYVGYLIKKGKLNLSLAYFIEDGMLKAKNEVFLDQFTFGEKVKSDQAINLPVKLAVALLKDRNGEIHLDIPVSGSLDDPQFSITGVVWTIIKNLLVKAATSPFALLGALVGGGDEDFSSVNFEPGSARLSDPEKDKLQRMSKALVERPGIDIEVSGFIDPENDPEGYRRELLSNQIKRAKYLDLIKNDKLSEGINQDNVTVSAEEYPDYLWEVYQQADFPKPRNFIGMTKKLPVAEMEKLIYASDTVSEEDLASLAQARAQTVQDFLTEEGQVAKERVFLKEQDISAAPDPKTAHRARVELGAMVR